jgi:hypothetical protein
LLWISGDNMGSAFDIVTIDPAAFNAVSGMASGASGVVYPWRSSGISTSGYVRAIGSGVFSGSLNVASGFTGSGSGYFGTVLGVATPANDLYAVNIQKTWSSGSHAGLRILATRDTANAGTPSAALCSMTLSHTTGTVSQAVGFQGAVNCLSGAGTTTTVYGAYGITQHDSGHTSTTVVGGAFGPNMTAGSSGAAVHGVWIVNTVAASGASGNYGLRIGNVASGAGFNRAISTGTGIHYFGDSGIFAGPILPSVSGANTVGGATMPFGDIYGQNAYHTVSDERSKRDISDLSLGLDFVNLLRPVQYRWRDYEYVEERETDPVWVKAEDGRLFPTPGPTERVTKTMKHSRQHFGFVAQEIKKTIDGLGIDSEDFGAWSSGATGGQMLRFGELLPMIVKAVQELSARIDKLEAK